MVFRYGCDAAAHKSARQGLHRHLGWVDTANQCLESLVGEGWLTTIRLNDSVEKKQTDWKSTCMADFKEAKNELNNSGNLHTTPLQRPLNSEFYSKSMNRILLLCNSLRRNGVIVYKFTIHLNILFISICVLYNTKKKKSFYLSRL